MWAMTLLPTGENYNLEQNMKRYHMHSQKQTLKSSSLSLKIKLWRVGICSYKRHETDTSQSVQTDGGCAGSLMRETKSVHGLYSAEGVRLHHGYMEASRHLGFPAFKSWVQLKGCLASQAKIYANIIRIKHLYRTADCVWKIETSMSSFFFCFFCILLFPVCDHKINLI